ncbi:2457_t:CDS:2 [Rhizophagus irregularis]|nr:2457_t:CDS:2 [Rhizophagus irregularis]
MATHSKKKETQKVWYKTASAYWLLPSFMLIAIINGLGITVKIQFYLRAVCYDYYSNKSQFISTSFLLNPINDYPDEWCNNADVQAMTSRFLLILDLCSAVPAIFVLAPLGLLSDIKGRKICLLIAVAGSILTTLNILLVGNYIDTFGIYFLLVGALFDGITGGLLSLISASYAYATDCTSPTQRSVIFGWMQGAFFAGFIGPTIGGWIIELTDNLLSVFYVMIAAIFLLYVTLVFKWSLVDQGYYFIILGVSRDNEEKHLRKYEVWILRFALFIDVLAYAGYGLATSSSMFVVASVIASLGSVSGSVIKSLQTNLVAPSQIGQLLGALCVLDSIGRIISPVVFNALYSILVVTSPHLIWYGVTFLIAAAFLLSFGIVPKYN